MPPVGRREQAMAWPGGAGESAAFVAEHFRFEQFVRDGRAVDRHEGAPRALADKLWIVAGDDFLAGAALARDQHRRIGGGHAIDQRPQV